jgi:RNA polymerase sigma factor (sigma-70 family)
MKKGEGLVMNHQWSFDQYEPPPPIQRYIQQQVRKLERHLPSFDPGALSLQGHIAKPKRKRLYELTLVLTLPGSSLTATEKGREVKSMLRSGFDALVKEAKASQDQPRLRRRGKATTGVKQPTLSRDAKPEAIEELISQHVPRLSQYVQREIAYYLATDELIPDLAPVEAVVDETVMRALTEYEARPANLPFDRWLITLASDVLDQRLQQAQLSREAAGRDEARVEQRLSRVPPEQQGCGVEDEMYDWYQPDENLHLEDIVADPHTPSPEEIATHRQLQQELDQTIAFLPKRWRDVFVLHSIEDFSLEQVSLVTGQSLEEIQQDLQSAREFLRARLTRLEAAARAANAPTVTGRR